MSCGEGVERGAATCVCKGQTVFEGAVIGQVFTGDVQIQCPWNCLSSSHKSGRRMLKAIKRTIINLLAIWHLATLQPFCAFKAIDGCSGLWTAVPLTTEAVMTAGRAIDCLQTNNNAGEK